MFRRGLLSGLVLACGALPACAQGQGQILNNFNPYQIQLPTESAGYWGYSWNPYEGYLRGGAAVIRAQGQYMINRQQANLIREQVNAAKIENRRATLEQWLWERETLPTLEDERNRDREQQLVRARNGPPATEIWSGKALNDLLADAQKIQSPGVRSASAPLPAETLAKINVTTGRSGANLGVIKNGEIFWPLLLRREVFKKDTEVLEKLVAQALRSASAKQMDAEAVEQIIKKVGALQKRLVSMARSQGDNADWNFTTYNDAKGFLNQFDDAIKVLQQPNAWQYVGGQFAAKGKTVGDLVQYMRDNGLFFAQATAGSEGAYTALYHALRDYDVEGGSPAGKSKNR